MKMMSNTDSSLVTPFFLALAMALKLYIHIMRPKDPDKLFCNFHCFRFAAPHQCCGQRAFLSARQADEPGGVLFQVLKRSRTFALGGLTHLEPGNQLTEILISHARGTQKGQPHWFRSMLMRQ